MLKVFSGFGVWDLLFLLLFCFYFASKHISDLYTSVPGSKLGGRSSQDRNNINIYITMLQAPAPGKYETTGIGFILPHKITKTTDTV